MPNSPFNWRKASRFNALKSYYYNTPAGQLILFTQDEVLCKIEWQTATPLSHNAQTIPAELQKQLDHYWLTPNINIMLPLLHQGTAFQHTVWTALRQIPVGQTKTYGELANELNTGARAFANACRHNPFPFIIPCHRVLSQNGIGGYAGAVSGSLIEIKEALLRHEKVIAHEL